MKFPKKSFSNEDVRMLTVVCGGVAFLIALAVWIAPNSDILISYTVPPTTEQSLAASTIPDSLTEELPPVDEDGLLAESGSGGGTCDKQPPSVITDPATDITPTSAVLHARGGSGCGAYSGAIHMWFSFDGKRVPATGYAGNTNAGYPVSGLQPNTTYSFSAHGQNNSGTATGGLRTFKTPGIPPAVVTLAETAVTQTGATLNGTVDPNGLATTYYYRYGKNTTTSCAALASVTPSASAGAAQTPANRPRAITGLTPGAIYRYCIVGTNAVGIKMGAVAVLTTGTASALPTLSISANGQLGTITVQKDSDVTIRATYVPATGDTLTATAINGPAPYTYAGVPAGYNWVSAAGVASIPPRSVVSFTFHPTQTGDFTFIPAALTTQHPSPWYDGNKFVTVHVECTGTCACPANTSSINGVCVPNSCPAGTHVQGSECVPNSTSCPNGSQLINGVCVPGGNGNGGPGNGDQCLNMPGNQSVVPANCVQQPLPSGGNDCVPVNSTFVVRGTQCVPRGVISAFSATPERLRAGESTTLSWIVGGMTSCGVTKINDSSTVIPQGAGSASDGVHQSQPLTVDQITTYRLTCSDGTDIFTAEKTVTVVPSYEEI